MPFPRAALWEYLQVQVFERGAAPLEVLQKSA